MSPVFGPLLLHLGVVFLIAMAMLALGSLFGRSTYNKTKTEPYESGIRPVTEAQQRFDVKFYLVAILFLVFDLEATFLYPWAVVYRKLGWFGFMEMLAFVAVLLTGYLYIVKKGALEWG
jgi:NADH-quinone oxidoreductase subunit A